MKFACIGDSLTFGYGLDEGESWVSVLAEKTGETFSNCGIPGNTTAEMLARIWADVLVLQPEVLFLLGGTNDIFLGETVAVARNNICHMVELARRQGIEPVILTPLPVYAAMPHKTWFLDCDYAAVNAALKQLGQELMAYGGKEDIACIDLWDMVAKRSDPENCFLADGIHVNREVHREIAAMIKQKRFKP